MSLVSDADGFRRQFMSDLFKMKQHAPGDLIQGLRAALRGSPDEAFERLQGKLPGAFGSAGQNRDHLSLARSPGQYRCS